VYFLEPDVVGVHLRGRLREGVTATDLVLTVTEMLRKAKVVGKFVEFHGNGAATLSATDRATIANMAPEYGATIGFFPTDDVTLQYFTTTGRSDEQVALVRAYYEAQGLFGMPAGDSIDYSQVLELDLGDIVPSVAGPKRPQDRVPLSSLGTRFRDLLVRPLADDGYGKTATQVEERHLVTLEGRGVDDLGHGDVLIAAITSCTNTSNPDVMLAAGLVAQKAAQRGLRVRPTVKTSLAPGSRVVTDYLERTGLQTALDQLGFNLVGFGCTTCIGNSGPLDPAVDAAVAEHDLVGAAVLSGNRNFEARVHPNVKANFLMSPPLVVAFALAGRVDTDLTKEPLGTGSDGKPVYLRDVWPTQEEVRRLLGAAFDRAAYQRLYADVTADNPLWNDVPAPAGDVYAWDAKSTYIQEPPYFESFPAQPPGVSDVHGARALAIFGDSVTTDHISPAGSIKATSPAGEYLLAQGVAKEDFNSYGARRGNHQVMVRGTFANVRIKNKLMAGVEGGITRHQPSGETLSIYAAAERYGSEGVPLVIFAGHEYGSGSSRDWAAKGTRLLGVRAVVAQSYERIHRSNLVGMGVLPCQFHDGTNAETLGLDGSETFDLVGIENGITPRQDMTLIVRRAGGAAEHVTVTLRIDTPVEVDYYRHGGILPYVLRGLLQA
jgi:aconitate hydratase